MAMTAQVKAEIANTHITKTCCRKAEVATMLRFAGGLHIVSGKIVVEAELVPNPQVGLVQRGDLDLVGARGPGFLLQRHRIDQSRLEL